MSNNLSTLTTAQLRRAADLKDKIEALNKELASILGESSPVPTKASKKRGMSAAGRASVAAAQKARWAKIKKAKPTVKPAKRKMSAAGRAKIAAAQKARWAKIKSEKAK